MTDFIPFAIPDLTEAEVEAVVKALRSGWITTGPETRAFGPEFAEAVGAPHAVMVNSCTAAMHLGLEALGLKAGDEVIVPTMTFAATAEVVRYFDATPVIVDIYDHDHNISVEAVKAAITGKTKGIMPVHFAGQMADMDELRALADAHGLFLLADAAHAFPASYKGKNVGELADITAFSFYATKTMTTAEGGAAVTADEALSKRMAVMALHGISRDAWNRYRSDGSWFYEVVAPGYKYNMTDLSASMGRVQLARSDAMLARRQEIGAAYDEAFGALDEVEVMPLAEDRSHARHLYVLKLNLDNLTIDRADFIEALKADGVGASVHFIPLHRHPYYRDRYSLAPEAFPVAEAAYARSVSLPIFSAMTDTQVKRVIEVVTNIIGRHRREEV